MSEINLRLEVTENDAVNMIKWLKNQNITKYLNEDINTVDTLQRVINNNQSVLLTYYLNQDGRFFLIDEDDGENVGFLNLFTLIPKKKYEIVIAIGEERNWGKQYGKKALIKIMREVFLEWKIDELTAKVHINNQRSILMFEHLNFTKKDVVNDHYRFSMDLPSYEKLFC